MPKSTKPAASSLYNYIDATQLSVDDIICLRERGSGASRQTTLSQLDAFFTFEDVSSGSDGSSSSASVVPFYCFSGAGTAGANGTYTINGGIFNGRQTYVNQSDPDFTLRYTGTGWEVYHTSLAQLYYREPADTPDSGVWTPTGGSFPAPTVTEGVCLLGSGSDSSSSS